MTESYYVLVSTEDGLRVSCYDKQELEAKILRANTEGVMKPEFLSNPHEWPDDWREGEHVIIKGHVVVPNRVEVVTRFEVE